MGLWNLYFMVMTEGFWDMSTKRSIKLLARKIERLVPGEPIRVLVKNYSTDRFDKALILPEELTRKYGIKTEN